MRDGVSVNGCALRPVKALYSKMFEVTCFSHTINLVGARFVVATLDQFIRGMDPAVFKECSSQAPLEKAHRSGDAVIFCYALVE